MKLWVAAYNIHLREWTSGGGLSEYPQAHYDVFQFASSCRDAAEQLAKDLRRKHVTLTERQRQVLRSLHEAVEGEPNTLKQWIEVSPGEDRVMERLAQLQLVTPDDTGHEVRLTHFAFNPSLLDKLRK